MKRKTDQTGVAVSHTSPLEGRSCLVPVFLDRTKVIGSYTYGQSAFASLRIFASIAVASVIFTLVWKSFQSGPVHSTQEETSATAKTLVTQSVTPHATLPIVIKGQPRENPAIPSDVYDALYGKSTAWDARLRCINNIGPNLAPADVALLLDYLRNPSPDDGLDPAHRRAFVNDIIFALRIQKTTVGELTGVLTNIFHDKTRDPGMRDYAIQHLSEWRWRAVEYSADAAQPIDNALWSAVRETSRPYAGTALLALQRLVEDQKMPDYNRYATAYKERLTTAARGIVSDGNAALASRISAMGICSEMGAAEAAPLATALLQAKDTPPTLQLAAFGTIIRSIPLGGPLDSEMRAIIEHATRSAYPPLHSLAVTTLRAHTF